jgi:hypothetical protein
MLRPEAPPAGCRVLIVEDEWFLANDLETILKSFGADVTTLAGDFDDARAQLAGGGFDVAIELSLEVGDGGNREGGISWGCLTPPLLHQRSDMPCPKLTSSS